MKRPYRSGAVGAMMDEYERASDELIRIIDRMDVATFEMIRDPQTTNPECRSIQTVMAHVIGSGYAYADYFRVAFDIPSLSPPRSVYTLPEAREELRTVLTYTAATLEGRWDMNDDEMMAVQIRTRWGGLYDVEQLMEHAIVHVLRHRRQIERFLAGEDRT